MAGAAVVQRRGEVFELRRQEVPVVEHLLQARCDGAGIVGAGEVARNDDELSVARAVFVRGKLHRSWSVWVVGGDRDALSMLDTKSWNRRPYSSPRRRPRLPGAAPAATA